MCMLRRLGRGLSDMVVYRERTDHEMDHSSAVKSVTSQGCNTHSDQERFTQCVDMYIALQAVREQQRQNMEMEASE